VFVVHLSTRSGDEYYAHATCERAWETVLAFAKSSWRSRIERGQLEPEDRVMPENQLELINKFYNTIAHMEEWYTLEECEVLQ
jgi:hypothetical protein